MAHYNVLYSSGLRHQNLSFDVCKAGYFLFRIFLIIFIFVDFQADQSVPKKRIKLDDIENIEHIEALTNRQLKEILACNFVDFKGCCERWELEGRCRKLWCENEKNKEKGRYPSKYRVFVRYLGSVSQRIVRLRAGFTTGVNLHLHAFQKAYH